MTMRFQTIVTSVENPKMPHELREALKLVSAGGRIHVLHTVPSAENLDAARRTAHDGLVAAATPFPTQARLALHVRAGDRAEQTLRLAVEADADLIVVGAFEPGASHLVTRVMAWATCSVLVLSPHPERAGAKGFVPLFPQCSACAEARKRDDGRWFCAQHEGGAHVFEALKP